MKPATVWLRLLFAYMALVAVGLWVRPLVPIDETRYAAVAWEMWSGGHWLYPHLNGAPYTHKPPLLFWLIHAGWAVFGVNAWWPRLLGPMMTLICLFLIKRLAERLWPERLPAHSLAPVVFLGTWYTAVYSAGVMFDMLLLTWILLAWLALWRAAQERSDAAMLGFGLCVGLAILSKGPVTLVYTLPLALAMRWWSPSKDPWRGVAWFGRVALIHVVALAIPMLWLAAVARSAGDEFLHQVLWAQTADRVVGTMGHGRPWWWYLPLVPLLAMPWILWPPAWRAMRRLRPAAAEPGVRFAVIGVVAAFLVLSATGGKQVHYLIPLLALAAMLLARLLAAPGATQRGNDNLVPALLMSPVPILGLMFGAPLLGVPAADWLADVPLVLVGLAVLPALWLFARPPSGVVAATARLGLASVLFLAVVVACVFSAVRPRYDLQAAGEFVGATQRAGRPVAYLGGKYQGEFGFYGRLREPVRLLRAREVSPWLAANPDGLLITRIKRIESAEGLKLAFSQPYKTDQLVMFRASDGAAAEIVFRD